MVALSPTRDSFFDQSSLPDQWLLKKVSELYEIVGGGTPSTNEPNYWNGSIPWISSADILGLKEVTPRRYITESAIKNSATNLVPAGSIIVVTRVGLGKLLLAPYPLCFSQDSHALLPNDDTVDQNYALYYLSQAVQAFRSNSRGTTIEGVTKKQLADTLFFLPPIEEQRRIVTKIEFILEQTRTARATLDCIPPTLKTFRQSVLAAAFRGELTERDPSDEPTIVLLERIRAERRQRWEESLREKGKDPAKAIYEEPSTLETANLPELPEGWVWTNLQTLADVRSGVTKGRDLSRFETIEVPYLRVANVQAGYLDLREVKQIAIKSNELEGYQLQVNDVLYTEGGDRDKLGRGTVWKGEISSCIHQNHIFCARLYLPEISPEWVSMTGQLEYARNYVNSVASQSVNLASINSTNLKAMPIPLPPEQEQMRIVNRIKELSKQVEAAEQAFFIASHLLDTFEQLVLIKAFRGEL